MEPRLRAPRTLSGALGIGLTVSLTVHAAILVLWIVSSGSSAAPPPRLAGVREDAPVRIRWEVPERPAPAIPAAASASASVIAPVAPHESARLRTPERSALAFGVPEIGTAYLPAPALLDPIPPPDPAVDPTPLLPPTRAASPSVLSREGPVLLDRVQPVYPESCLRARHEGTVELILAVDAEGRVTSARIVGKSSCAELDDAARRAALRLRYEPARENGRTVAGEARLRVQFVIEGPRSAG